MSTERYTRYEPDRYRGRDMEGPRGDPWDRREFGTNRPNWGSARSDYGRRAYGGRLDEAGLERDRRWRADRGFVERGTDEVRSWFGDEDAERRRRMDEQQDRREYAPRQATTGARARDLMTFDVACVRPDDPVTYAARLMRDCDCGAIPVIDREGRLKGMITDRDIAVRLVARGADIRNARVDDYMTDETFACNEMSDIEDCMREMSRHQVRRMPIVDRGGRVVGIVSQSDLARHAEDHRGSGERRAVADVLCAVSEPSTQPYR